MKILPCSTGLIEWTFFNENYFTMNIFVWYIEFHTGRQKEYPIPTRVSSEQRHYRVRSISWPCLYQEVSLQNDPTTKKLLQLHHLKIPIMHHFKSSHLWKIFFSSRDSISEMPCDAHTVFYRGCGHVFLAQSEFIDSEFKASDTPSKTQSQTQSQSHTSPTQFPCNKYLPYTINISPSSCQDCTTLPDGFKMQTLGADPKDIEAFNSFSKQWVEQVEANMKMEGDIGEAVLKSTKEEAKPAGLKKTSSEKNETQKELEEDLLDWGEAKSEEYGGLGVSASALWKQMLLFYLLFLFLFLFLWKHEIIR